MCGIAGWYRRGGRRVDAKVVAAQCDAIRHRGPDDEGITVDGDFGFGMRRLSIIDPAGGHQPMVSGDGRFEIVFNGEIYNHLALRETIGGRVDFRTRSDTETILAAFQVWGQGAWSRLEGMFAVAIWDRAERALTLARDPLGIKPLYVAEQADGLAFASELKALRPVPDLAFEMDTRAVNDFFCFGHVRRPRSIYQRVSQLEPGSSLVIGSLGEARREVFWRPRFAAPPALSRTAWIERFQETWLATVKRHMLSDAPVGVFLSGGVDSSAIAAAMARQSEQPIKAFTIGFPSARFDETPYARRVADHLGLEHVVRVVDLKAAADILPRLQRAYDEPFADAAAVPTWYLSELAAQHVKVVLGGDGGDELFAGYRRHRNEQRMQLLAPWIGPLAGLSRQLDRLPAGGSRRMNYLRQRVRRFTDTALLPDGYCRFFAKTQITSPAMRAKLFGPSMRDPMAEPGWTEALRDEYFPGSAVDGGLRQFMLADMTLQLPSGVLTKVDRASMAHSLEVRTPFLSHTFVDWAMGAPDALKLRGGTGKYLLRRAVEPWLPLGVLDRPKQGFQMPLADWFAGDLGAYVRGLWADGAARTSGILDAQTVERLIEEHTAGRQDHSRFLYALCMFILWCETQGR